MTISSRQFFNFGQTFALKGSCSVAFDITAGGVMGQLTTAVYDTGNQLLLSGGVDPNQPRLMTQQGGHVSWVFAVPPSAKALSWATRIFGPLPNASSYIAVVRVVDSQGNEVAKSAYAGRLTSAAGDPWEQDGILLI